MAPKPKDPKTRLARKVISADWKTEAGPSSDTIAPRTSTVVGGTMAEDVVVVEGEGGERGGGGEREVDEVVAASEQCGERSESRRGAR